eukprot:5745541-Heterocapsa_arctica.AAC.1
MLVAAANVPPMLSVFIFKLAAGAVLGRLTVHLRNPDLGPRTSCQDIPQGSRVAGGTGVQLPQHLPWHRPVHHPLEPSE